MTSFTFEFTFSDRSLGKLPKCAILTESARRVMLTATDAKDIDFLAVVQRCLDVKGWWPPRSRRPGGLLDDGDLSVVVAGLEARLTTSGGGADAALRCLLTFQSFDRESPLSPPMAASLLKLASSADLLSADSLANLGLLLVHQLKGSAHQVSDLA